MSICFRFGILLPTILALLGASFVVWAGPCYINTTTLPASEHGCSEAWFGPTGSHCPSMRNPFIGDSPACGFGRVAQQIGIGTSGNESSGRMSQGSVSRLCYKYQYCESTGLYWNGYVPIAPNICFDCLPTEIVAGSATHPSWEATGGSCPSGEQQ